ncbi:uncharacterized protein LOC106703149 [Latimeria chalumnae]|uniref:uncharacterized protein LOC106703149 n=1 Tax=Latimeria chalumnae TaxID=7897 RepID=UPI00313CDEE6
MTVKRFHHWNREGRQRSEERLQLAEELTETLGEVQERSGIFLIKPILSWQPGLNSMNYSRKISVRRKRQSKTEPLVVSPSSPSVQAAKAQSGVSAVAPEIPTSAGLHCMNSVSGICRHHKLWNLKESELGFSSSETGEGRSITPRVMIPRLLELDVNRYLFNQHGVSLQIPDCSSFMDPPPRLSRVSLRSFLPLVRNSPPSLSRERYVQSVPDTQLKFGAVPPVQVPGGSEF